VANLRLRHDVIASIGRIGEGKGTDGLFKLFGRLLRKLTNRLGIHYMFMATKYIDYLNRQVDLHL